MLKSMELSEFQVNSNRQEFSNRSMKSLQRNEKKSSAHLDAIVRHHISHSSRVFASHN